jgi:HD superfamily phosphodiesterase
MSQKVKVQTLHHYYRQIEEEIWNIVQKKMKHNNGSHNIRHIKDVLAYVIVICHLEKVDCITYYLIRIATILHDICRTEELNEDHAKAGARFAKKLLSSLNMHSKDIDLIVDAIYNHCNFYGVKSLVGRILYDADKLSRISLWGFITWVWSSGYNNWESFEQVEKYFKKYSQIKFYTLTAHQLSEYQLRIVKQWYWVLNEENVFLNKILRFFNQMDFESTHDNNGSLTWAKRKTLVSF